MRPSQLLTAAAAAAAVLSIAPAAASAENIVGIDTANRLVSFESTGASSARTKAVTGLPMGEQLVGIDRRPANGTIVLLGQSSRLYTLNLGTGVATAIGGGPFTPALNGTNFGFDFNPMVDRIRVVSNFSQNLRLQPDTGAVAGNDAALNFVAGDSNAGKVPALSGSAYTNNVPMATTTQLFGIDVTQDALALQDPPNAGGLKSIGGLQQGDIVSPVGFDIAAKTGNSFASLRKKNRKGSALYTVNLTTGRAAALGAIASRGRAITLRGLTVAE